MRITLHGAAGCVTGSAYHIETSHASVLLDFGVFQGTREEESRNVVPRSLDVGKLDCVILTHAHLDHTGRLPLLARRGYRKAVFATPASIEMAGLILRDSAKILEQDAERANRRRQNYGHGAGRDDLDKLDDAIVPMFTMEDAENLLRCMRPIAYLQPTEIAPGITATMTEAGHMLGSASIEILAEDQGIKKRIVFSGDIGPRNMPILKTYTPPQHADLVFLESTYGDRDHKSPEQTRAESQKAILGALERKGKILVPAFAIGRTQQVLYELARRFMSGELPRFPIYLDSPMAISASRLYREHEELLDEEAARMAENPAFNAELDRIHICQSVDESKALNTTPGPFMVVAASGMCNAGRIVHHLRQNLSRPETLVMVVGYQGAGTLGRTLVDGARRVSIFGDMIEVNAHIATLGGYSAHAGQTDLVNWIAPVAAKKPRIVLTHGEARGRKPLARLIAAKFGIDALLPELGAEVEV